jgi:hypothetical protein
MKLMTMQRVRRVRYYSKAFSQHFLVPDSFYRRQLQQKLDTLSDYGREAVLERVGYCNKLGDPFPVPEHALTLRQIPCTKHTMYYYDYRKIVRHFPPHVRAVVSFEDDRGYKECPTMLKSRPVGVGNANSVVMRLDSTRHFVPCRDPLRHEDKKDLLVWRGAVWQGHRKAFLRQYWNHPLCDAGQVNSADDPEERQWVKAPMSIRQQLDFKFILSIEGNDVATNLKWISQTNSLCFMTKPKFETWFMEGALKAGIHYVELRDDYADLPEKVDHYRANPEEAKAIIANFQAHHRQFVDRKQEELVGLLVALKYFERSGQYSIPGIFG